MPQVAEKGEVDLKTDFNFGVFFRFSCSRNDHSSFSELLDTSGTLIILNTFQSCPFVASAMAAVLSAQFFTALY